MIERREVLFFGRVQGVGFRYTTRDLAGQFQVTGYVRNQIDGSVQLVVEGEAAENDRFVAAIKLEMERYIMSSTSSTGPATGEFANFTVRF